MKKRILTLTFGLSLSAAVAMGGLYHVDVNGGGDYLTIQEGMDAAASGDTVLVAAGTYAIDSTIDFGGREIVLMSEGGPGSTIIDCQQSTAAISWNGEGAGTRLSGFTIENGATNGYGGAIACRSGTASIVSNCIIQACSALQGGGIYIHNSPVSVTDCTIIDCTATENGGGIYSYNNSSVSLTNLIVGRNTADYGGGIYLWYGSPSVGNCTIFRNASLNGGAVYCRSSYPQISNCIIAFTTEGEAVSCPSPATPTITHCDVFGNAGGNTLCGVAYDNLDSDPLFCGMDASGDVSLCSNSPCLALAGHNPWEELIGATDATCGDCDTPVLERTWGEIKVEFR